MLSPIKKQRNYVFYSLCWLVIISTCVIFVLSLYRLQLDANLLSRDRKRDYVTNKINKSFPVIAMISSLIVCSSSIISFIALLMNFRKEILIISSIANLILGVGLIMLGVIMLGFIQNIVQHISIDLERLLVDFIDRNQTSAREELLKIENSNHCCVTQHSIWIEHYSNAAECSRENQYRTIYVDQDEKRGCVGVISQLALTLMPVLVVEIICGFICLLLGLWTIYVVYRINQSIPDRESANEPNLPMKLDVRPSVRRFVTNIRPSIKQIDSYDSPRRSFMSMGFNKPEKTLLVNPVNL